MKISVIIPVFNAQKYIGRAIESALAQTYSELEILLVDDESTDDSVRIMQQYTYFNDKVSFFSQKNAGPGVARNRGIQNATGEYIFFLDADDYLPNDALEQLVKVAKTYPYDVIKGMYYNCSGDSKIEVQPAWTEGIVLRNGSADEVKRYHKIKTSSTFGYLWGALYKKSFLEKIEISMAEIPLRFMEDTVFNLELFAYHPEYYVVSKPIYFYTIQDDGLSSNRKKDFFMQVMQVIDVYTAFLKQKRFYKENLDLLIPLVARCFCWSCLSTVTNHNVTVSVLKEKIAVFMNQTSVYESIHEKSLCKHLFSIDSKIQGLVYTIFCLLLKWKAYGILASIFVCLKIPMNAYIKMHLKK